MSLPDFKYKQCIFYFSQKDKEILRFKADNIVIENDQKEIMLQHSCHRIFALFIIGNITITNVLIKKAAKFAFPVILLSRNLKLDAYFNNRAEGNFLLRRKQYSADKRNMEVAQQLIKQKIDNQAALLMKLRHRARKDSETIEKLHAILPLKAQDGQELLGMEGFASKIFFNTYFRQIKWIRREPRTKRDIINLLMDIGYTYLFNFIEGITALYGFDVYCGVYHTFFYQRKSLICDLVEPFRCIIDARLRKAYNLGQIEEKDFYTRNNQFFLSYKNQSKYTKLFVKDILEYKENIFLFIQEYYRWFMKDKKIEDFPVFNISGV
jgi:CRISPR-associated protein Cas1